MARWRLTAWFPERPTVQVRRYWRGDCKLCAIDRAILQASQMEKTWQRAEGSAEWMAESLTGVVDQWVIRFTSRKVNRRRMWSHGH